MVAKFVKTYRGVLCLKCGAAIPVSERVASLTEEDDGLHTFLCRCIQCEEENRYLTTDIRVFSGEPIKSRSRMERTTSERLDSSWS